MARSLSAFFWGNLLSFDCQVEDTLFLSQIYNFPTNSKFITRCTDCKRDGCSAASFARRRKYKLSGLVHAVTGRYLAKPGHQYRKIHELCTVCISFWRYFGDILGHAAFWGVGYSETSPRRLVWSLGAEAVTGGCLAKPGRKPRKLQSLQSPHPAPPRPPELVLSSAQPLNEGSHVQLDKDYLENFKAIFPQIPRFWYFI